MPDSPMQKHHDLWGPRDPWDLDTPELAYTMAVTWSDEGDPNHMLLVVGDLGCPAVRVNHEHYWGKCARADACNCEQ